MLARLVVGFVALASVAHSEGASTIVGPVLVGEVTRPECRAALDMATAAFRSTSPLLIWPVQQPDAALAALVLSRKDSDISGGDGILADPAVFERMQLDERPFWGQIVHWQRDTRDNRRILVVETPFSWQGSRYSLFLVDAALSPESFPQAFLSAFRANFQQAEEGPAILRPVLYKDSWATPTILRDAGSGRLWVLEQGQFTFWQPEWQIHASDVEGVSLLCRVVFNADGSAGLVRMPTAVQRFAAFADEALGPGIEEGTLQPTQGIRNQVAHGWTTLAERPWALTTTPDNSRKEVEAGLAAWAEGVPARSRLHQRLLDSLQPAEDALTEFLSNRFAIGEDDARLFATYAIDHMLRSYFTFHSDVGGLAHTPSVTPWPESLRE
jgi:hypothetical protein